MPVEGVVVPDSDEECNYDAPDSDFPLKEILALHGRASAMRVGRQRRLARKEKSRGDVWVYPSTDSTKGWRLRWSTGSSTTDPPPGASALRVKRVTGLTNERFKKARGVRLRACTHRRRGPPVAKRVDRRHDTESVVILAWRPAPPKSDTGTCNPLIVRPDGTVVDPRGVPLARCDVGCPPEPVDDDLTGELPSLGTLDGENPCYSWIYEHNWILDL